ncbi:36.4 kDa proline-rich protein [Melia azedarach]|uniref:36.4 kDa proline-rich protein n=1 Tax=Melia azedarach TaxID=155640 RepID=A0ACC1X2U1_MELAZ|nr:36.4 kDa proline-rich protein [Melia azedarach]
MAGKVTVLFVLFLNLSNLLFSASGYPSQPLTTIDRSCPIDTLKLGACVNVLGGLINVGIGDGAKRECCPLLGGLVDLDASLCLCTAIKIHLEHVIDLVIPLALDLLVGCGKDASTFRCSA